MRVPSKLPSLVDLQQLGKNLMIGGGKNGEKCSNFSGFTLISHRSEVEIKNVGMVIIWLRGKTVV